MAAKASDEVYGKPHLEVNGVAFEASRDIKASNITVREVNGKQALVVAIRGSATLDDWILNVNGDLVFSDWVC